VDVISEVFCPLSPVCSPSVSILIVVDVISEVIILLCQVKKRR